MLGYQQKIYSILFAMGLAILAATTVLFFFYSVGLNGILPVWPSFLLAIVISIGWGLIFHKQILFPKNQFHSFLLGMGLLLLSLPLFDIGALFFIKDQFQGTQLFHANFSEYATLYLMILIYSLIFIGSWLSVLCGLASVLFKKVLSLAN